MTTNKVEFAGLCVRSVAYIIDSLWIGLVAGFLVSIASIIDNDESTGLAAKLVFQVLMPIAATVAFWLKKQATPGKMLFNLKVIDFKTGKNLSVGQALGRYMACSVHGASLLLLLAGVVLFQQGIHAKPLSLSLLLYSLMAIPFTLGMLSIALDEHKRGWHDKLAGTAVIVQRKQQSVINHDKPPAMTGISQRFDL